MFTRDGYKVHKQILASIRIAKVVYQSLGKENKFQEKGTLGLHMRPLLLCWDEQMRISTMLDWMWSALQLNCSSYCTHSYSYLDVVFCNQEDACMLDSRNLSLKSCWSAMWNILAWVSSPCCLDNSVSWDSKRLTGHGARYLYFPWYRIIPQHCRDLEHWQGTDCAV